MQIKQLIWDYVDSEHCLWLGTTDGLLSHITFLITRSTAVPDTYTVRMNPSGITENYTELETAKARAQELLNSYALSLIIP